MSSAGQAAVAETSRPIQRDHAFLGKKQLGRSAQNEPELKAMFDEAIDAAKADGTITGCRFALKGVLPQFL
jgi:hypothetical protein